MFEYTAAATIEGNFYFLGTSLYQMLQLIVIILVFNFAIIDVMRGYNGTLFAYGQTGSGKTHTMMVF